MAQIQSRLASLQLDFVPAKTNNDNKTSHSSSHNNTSAASFREDFSSVSKKVSLSDLAFTFDKPQPKKTNTTKNSTPVISRNIPTFDEIRNNGKALKRGDKGEPVKQLQQKLTDLGYPVKSTGEFGPTTESLVKQYQRKHGITPTGQFGPTTLKSMEGALKVNSSPTIKPTQVNSRPTPNALKLATTAKTVAVRRDTYGWCYAGVATAVNKVFGDTLYGKSAYQAAGILSKNPNFKEVKVKASDLPKLQAGTIVVWGKTNVSPNGHISVSLGNGKEASDHVTNQLTSLRGHQNFRVFVPTSSNMV